jgi:hypothetical protein
MSDFELSAAEFLALYDRVKHMSRWDQPTGGGSAGVRIEPGDLLFVRVGHRSRRKAPGPWDAANARAGLHPAALELLAERRR